MLGIGALEDWLGVSRHTVKMLMESGMPGAKIGGTWVFHKDAISEWIKAGTQDYSPKEIEGEK
jgi:excisionase family DNA binding protein